MNQKPMMPAYLAIVSKREVRKYTDREIPDEIVERMLQAGRATGSSRNRQPWRFYVVRNRETLDRLGDSVSAPANLKGCRLAIAIVMTRSQAFDAGRVAQNIALAAWADGIGTCPNTPRDLPAIRSLLDLEEDWDVPTILSAGFPAEALRPLNSDPGGILERIDRKPLDELTHWID
ncbi:MAG: nitroreductase family protein [Thermomicrobiales bacterium]